MCFSDGEVQLKYWKEAAVGAFMAVAASGASAATCGPATGDTKTVTVTSGSATVECYAYGSGNINGNVKQDPILNGQTTGKNTFTLVSGPVITGLTFLDNTSESGGAKDGGVTSNGSSTVGQSVVGKVTVGDVSPYSGLILALKIGKFDDGIDGVRCTLWLLVTDQLNLRLSRTGLGLHLRARLEAHIEHDQAHHKGHRTRAETRVFGVAF